MSVGLQPVLNRQAKLKTLKKQYVEQASRRPPDWDDKALEGFIKTLKGTKSQIAEANANVHLDVDYLIGGIREMADHIMFIETGAEPPNGDPDAVREWLKSRDEIIDTYLARVYKRMEDKPFGEVELADGSKQKEIDGALIEQADEKSSKKGRKKKGEKDDGSNAEAATPVETTEIVDAEEETHITGPLPEPASDKAPVDLSSKRNKKDKAAKG